ncbi:MAG: hypothetical protein A3E83_03345 [Gammaproteobacteria bacterium RIFCSPHIGHO2_12_FULL_41_20]|nr:MAG: hypothetical protein A3E83_03345 [Gammaproteobacteria bacterium RIFCSPHIGHO2_12_FULL_41_20]
MIVMSTRSLSELAKNLYPTQLIGKDINLSQAQKSTLKQTPRKKHPCFPGHKQKVPRMTA